MTSSYDVIVAGNYSIDHIFIGMDELPQLGKDIHSKAFLVTPGESFIATVAMHRLGIKVGWAADFGNDEYSQLALKFCRAEGLDESLFIIHDRPYRRISVAASYPQDRGFITYYDPDPKIPAALSTLHRIKSKYIFIPGLFSGSTFEAGLKLIRLKNMKLIMDGNSSIGDIIGYKNQCKAIRKAIMSTDIFLPNSLEARRMTGLSDLEQAARALARLCPLVVIKDGANGSLACSGENIIHISSIPVTPIDTTGAGDNFNAGFICAMLKGQPLENCLKWGNITGALSTTEIGGTTYEMTLDKLEKALNKYYLL